MYKRSLIFVLTILKNIADRRNRETWMLLKYENAYVNINFLTFSLGSSFRNAKNIGYKMRVKTVLLRTTFSKVNIFKFRGECRENFTTTDCLSRLLLLSVVLKLLKLLSSLDLHIFLLTKTEIDRTAVMENMQTQMCKIARYQGGGGENILRVQFFIPDDFLWKSSVVLISVTCYILYSCHDAC